MNLSKIRQPFLEKFPGDFSGNAAQRSTPKILFCTTKPVVFPKAELLIFNKNLAQEIGLGNIDSHQDKDFLSAQYIPENIQPYATAYAGHQFGNWAGQLGDGRAIFAGEIENDFAQKNEIQWKGAGATPYSRNADGRAVLRSSVREYLMSEAMHFLHIPTTRALSLSLSGETVIRDILYNGNQKEEKGAIIMRTAESFLRFGHFELMSAQKEIETLQQLTDFTIQNYFPEIDVNAKERYKQFYHKVCEKTAQLMVDWQRVGFVHGVMNTDNMSILGLSIDYGPFSMLDQYDLNFTSNTTDLPDKRYAFGKQPQISQFNLWQLGNALFPLIKDEIFFENEMESYSQTFWQLHDQMLCDKFGLDTLLPNDEAFFTQWQQLMQDLHLDYTLFFNAVEKLDTLEDFQILFKDCFYTSPTERDWEMLETFLENYQLRLHKNKISRVESQSIMQKSNPKFTLRNYLLYECIEQIEIGNTQLLDDLLVALQDPYKEIFPAFSGKRPAKYDNTLGCSMLSCSS